MIAGVVLAAGAGTRFGSEKQLADLGGRPLLEHVLRTMGSARLDRTVVVLGAAADEILAAVDLHGAEAVVCDSWEEGQSASLARGLAELAEADAVVVALGDQPRVSPQAIERVLSEWDGEPAVRATYGDRPGHPVLLARELFGRIRDVTGDRGARSVLESAATRDVPCDDLGGAEDVDTPEDLAALRSAGRAS